MLTSIIKRCRVPRTFSALKTLRIVPSFSTTKTPVKPKPRCQSDSVNVTVSKINLRSRSCASLHTQAAARDYSKTRPLLIRGGTVVNHDTSVLADVFCDKGKIVRVGANLKSNDFPSQTREIDASGKFVMPGGIEPHTHMEMPFMGTVSIDDYNYGTRAALAGGTTHLIDFVIPKRNQSLLEAYDEWYARAEPKINCDISFHMAVTWFGDQVLKDMEVLTKERGVQSYKFFLAYNGVLRTYDDELLALFSKCREIGALAQVHAENGDMVEAMQKKILDMGITGPEGHALSRPECVEAEATHRSIELAHQARVPLYVVHVMSKSAAREIAAGKARGRDVYGETLAAAIGVDGREMWNKDWRHAAGYVMSPPIREDPSTPAFLVDALKSGDLDLIGTDNCTFNANQKALGRDRFDLIPNGVNGIEDRMSLMWHKGVKGADMTPNDFVRLTSTKAAMIFNLYPHKGRIAPGADADIVVWDGEATRTVSAKTHHHAVDFNIFEGQTLHGVSDYTIAAGRVCWENGELQAENGWGRIIPRTPFQYVYRDRATREHSIDPRRLKVDREPYTGPVVEV
jgi:dihydropyrimidinase